MSAIDPDGDNIRYGIDWNADGSIDEYVPPSGYVQFRHERKTPPAPIRPPARRPSRYLHKTKAASSPAGPRSRSTVPMHLRRKRRKRTSKTSALPPTSATATTCIFRSGPQCAETFVQSCSYACSGGACLLPPGGIGNITATPSLVRTGQTSTINWTTSGMTACSVAENNPTIADAWTETNGTEQSSPITEQTIYTLSCSVEGGGTFTDTATINIVPVFQEN